MQQNFENSEHFRKLKAVSHLVALHKLSCLYACIFYFDMFFLNICIESGL